LIFVGTRQPLLGLQKIAFVGPNPYRPGSDRWHRFNLYRVDQTIPEFRKKCWAARSPERRKGFALGLLRHDIAKGHIRLKTHVMSGG
jgi:hypothetical protein